MPNPFVYGEVVPASAFVDRIDELDRLVRDLEAAQKVFLISPRRYGKSSLIRRALHAMERKSALTIEITVSSYSSYVAFLEGFARGVATAEASADRPRGWLQQVIRSARAEVRYDAHLTTEPGRPQKRSPVRRADGDQPSSVSVSFPTVRSEREISRLAEEVFSLPDRLAEARRRPVVVALDEFQAVAGFNGGSVEHALRAAVQHQRRVGYVFAGSEPALMERMISPRRPFYKAGPVMRLDRIPAEEFALFIDEAFSRSGLRPEPGLGAAVVDLAANLPYDVQRLAHETWDQARAAGRRRALLDDLHQALRRLLAEHQMIFESLWQHLTLAQRAVLRALVVENGAELLSADVRARHRLGGPSTVQASLAALVRDDLVARDGTRYRVVDSLLREWVARRTF